MADPPVGLGEQVAALERSADELLVVELDAALGATAGLDRWLEDSEALLISAWDANVAGDRPPTRTELDAVASSWSSVAVDDALGVDPTGRILAGTARAVDQAGEALIAEGGDPFTRSTLRRGRILNDRELLAGVHRGVNGAQADLATGLTELLDAMEDPALEGTLGLEDLLDRLRGTHSRVRNRTLATARYATNLGANMARKDLATQAQVGVTWSPERDACVRCLAYAGIVVEGPAETFPVGLSLDPEDSGLPLAPDLSRLDGPPLHPHCRCQLTPWSRAWGTSLPDALRREADRSALKGWALPSENETTRRRAAESIRNNPRAIEVKSVLADAKRRLRRDADFRRATPTIRRRMPPPPPGPPPTRPSRGGPPRLPGDGTLDPDTTDVGDLASAAERIAESNRTRRAPRRRAAEARIAADDDAAALLEAENLDPAVASRAIDQVKDLRTRARSEAADTAADLFAELEQLEAANIGTLPRTATVTDNLGRKRTRYVDANGDPVGADWDWLETADGTLIREMTRAGILSPNTITEGAGVVNGRQVRGTRRVNPDAGELDLDTVALLGSEAGLLAPDANNDTVAQWVLDRSAAYLDAVSVAGGRPPRFGTNLDSIAPGVGSELGALSIDPNELHSTPELLATRIAIGDLELRARYESAGILQTESPAPPAYTLTADEYAVELAAVDRAYREHVIPRMAAGPDPSIGEILFTPEEDYARKRYAELVPEGLVPSDQADTLDAHTLHQRLRWVADYKAETL